VLGLVLHRFARPVTVDRHEPPAAPPPPPPAET